MALDEDYDKLRDAINDCIGYRVLDDDDIVAIGDETIRGSALLGEFPEEWSPVDDDELRDMVGRPVRDLNNDDDGDMDAAERLFRRRVA